MCVGQQITIFDFFVMWVGAPECASNFIYHKICLDMECIKSVRLHGEHFVEPQSKLLRKQGFRLSKIRCHGLIKRQNECWIWHGSSGWNWFLVQVWHSIRHLILTTLPRNTMIFIYIRRELFYLLVYIIYFSLYYSLNFIF